MAPPVTATSPQAELTGMHLFAGVQQVLTTQTKPVGHVLPAPQLAVSAGSQSKSAAQNPPPVARVKQKHWKPLPPCGEPP
jgi:hypothetical protein